MPEARLERTRKTLPEGYQFGDEAPSGLPFHKRGAVRRAARELADSIDAQIAREVYALSAMTVPVAGPGADYSKAPKLFSIGQWVCHSCGQHGSIKDGDGWMERLKESHAQRSPNCGGFSGDLSHDFAHTQSLDDID